jgi:hypothetical protein
MLLTGSSAIISFGVKANAKAIIASLFHSSGKFMRKMV